MTSSEGEFFPFHFIINDLDRRQIGYILGGYGVPEDVVPRVSRCCAVGCDNIYAYGGMKNPSYCPKCVSKKNQPARGVPYGQSKL